MPPFAPRPFSQMARWDVKLYGGTLQGLRGALRGAPWYRRQRRRPAVALRRGHLMSIAARRACRAFWSTRPLYLDPITQEVA